MGTMKKGDHQRQFTAADVNFQAYSVVARHHVEQPIPAGEGTITRSLTPEAPQKDGSSLSVAEIITFGEERASHAGYVIARRDPSGGRGMEYEIRPDGIYRSLGLGLSKLDMGEHQQVARMLTTIAEDLDQNQQRGS